MSDPGAWTNGPPTPPLTMAALDAAVRALDALPPTVHRIDAPSTVIAGLRRAATCSETPPSVIFTSPLGSITLRVDNDLPLHTVRYHWTDGRIEDVRLDTIDSAGNGGR